MTIPRWDECIFVLIQPVRRRDSHQWPNELTSGHGACALNAPPSLHTHREHLADKAVDRAAAQAGGELGIFACREPKANAAMMMELTQRYAQGKIKPVIDRAMPMNELEAAYAHMGSRGVMGKLVMVN